jgi:hypothetical protein
MRLFALTMVPLLCAGAAFAQIQIGPGAFEQKQNVEPGCESPSGRIAKAKLEFVENFRTANAALKAEDWAGVIGSAALARPHVIDRQQEQALIQLEGAAYHGVGNASSMIERIETYLAMPCNVPAIRKNYIQMLEKTRSGIDASPEQ